MLNKNSNDDFFLAKIENIVYNIEPNLADARKSDLLQ